MCVRCYTIRVFERSLLRLHRQNLLCSHSTAVFFLSREYYASLRSADTFYTLTPAVRYVISPDQTRFVAVRYCLKYRAEAECFYCWRTKRGTWKISVYVSVVTFTKSMRSNESRIFLFSPGQGIEPLFEWGKIRSIPRVQLNSRFLCQYFFILNTQTHGYCTETR